MQRKKFDDVFKSVANTFKLLANADRLRILGLLSEEEMDVGNLSKAIGISQSSVSQHLKLLRMNHLVSEKRQGKRVFYKSVSPLIKNIIIDAVEMHAEDLSKETKTVRLYNEIKSILTT